MLKHRSILCVKLLKSSIVKLWRGSFHQHFTVEDYQNCVISVIPLIYTSYTPHWMLYKFIISICIFQHMWGKPMELYQQCLRGNLRNCRWSTFHHIRQEEVFASRHLSLHACRGTVSMIIQNEGSNDLILQQRRHWARRILESGLTLSQD